MFKLEPKELSDLFHQDNIRKGTSIENLKRWGATQGVAGLIRTDLKTGRKDTPQEDQERRNRYGDNAPIVKIPKTLWEMILENFEDDMLKVLCASAVVSLVLGIATEGLHEGWMEGTSILAAVVIIISVTAGNNYVKEKQFQKLNAIAGRKDVQVIRGGEKIHISVYEMLVGDIQEVETGEIISVDGIIIESNGVVTDESAMTGEPIQLKKFVLGQEDQRKADPFLISGSKVLEGTGKMMVLAVGGNSQYGILKKGLLTENDETPLQQKLEILAEQIGKVGTICALITFLVLMGHIVVDAIATGDFTGSIFRMDTLHEVVQSFIVAVSIIVVSVPEGLPLAVTIALAYSVGKMKEENNLVRYLSACETMGGVDNICSDKTGTLTKNIMAVTRMFVGEKVIDKLDENCVSKRVGWLIGKSICQNSNANPKITRTATGNVDNLQIGNKTECALLELAFRLGYDYKQHRKENHNVKIFPFASKFKSMTTIFSEKQGQVYVFSKGGPDFIFGRCSSYLDSNGEVQPMNDKFKRQLDEKIKEFADATLRTLLLTYRDGKGCSVATQVEDAANGLIVIGMVGIKDPIREEIFESVKKCHQAGVVVRMITGDNKDTAVAIAKEAGILQQNYACIDNDHVVMLGEEFRSFVGPLETVQKDKGSFDRLKDLTNFKIVAKNLRVLARSSPTDKYIMATGLKQLNHVVAMTGDGTNDAPALKKADIGFAMGITGTEVAKEAAGIILLDDNFKSIVTAMKWGRNIFDSIRKFLQFQLTVNFVALVMAFSGAAVLKMSPLNPIQMLWVNLIMDTLASLALATEPPSEELLKRKPYSRFEGLITVDMWKNIITQGILQIIILGTILFKGDEIFDIPSSFGQEWTPENGKQLSLFFHTFVMLQIFNEINSRKLKSTQINVFQNYFNNPIFHIIMVATIIIQIACIEYGGEALKAVPLTIQQHLICIGLGISSVFAGILFKLLVPSSLFQFLVKPTQQVNHEGQKRQ